MKLATIRRHGTSALAVVRPDGALVDLAGLGQADAPRDMLELIERGPSYRPALDRLAAAAEAAPAIPSEEVEFRPPVLRPSKIVAIALNNSIVDQMRMSGPTDHPAIFIKATSSLIGHGQPIRVRESYGLTHPEPELAVVVGGRLSDAAPDEALGAVFGYTILNDVTSVGMRREDSFHLRYPLPDPATGRVDMVDGHTSYAGRYKGTDTFGPCGPWIVTSDDIADPHALDVTCWVGGELQAADNTRNLRFKVPEALAFISRFLTLLPGDIVSMGTAAAPPADGRGANIFASADLRRTPGPVTIEISGIGRLSNPVLKV